MEEYPPPNAYIAEDPLTTYIKGITIRLLFDYQSPRPKLILELDEFTNFDAINRNRGRIKELIKGLEQEVGSDLEYNQRKSLYALLQWKKPGFGWDRLTMLLNYLCFALTYASYEEGLQKVKNKETPDMILGDADIEVPSELDVTWLIHDFFALGKDFEDLDEWMQQGQDYLARDQFPMRLRDEPFYSRHVRDKVRYFQKSIQAGNIIISENDLNWNILEFKIYIMYRKGYFEKIDKVLDKEGMKDWLRNKKLIQRKISGIIDKWESAENSKIARMRDLLKSWENR